MWQAIVFGFLGGVLGANGFPHFTRGPGRSAGRSHQTRRRARSLQIPLAIQRTQLRRRHG